jgi:hypothetical protein
MVRAIGQFEGRRYSAQIGLGFFAEGIYEDMLSSREALVRTRILILTGYVSLLQRKSSSARMGLVDAITSPTNKVSREIKMKLRTLVVILLICLAPLALALGQSSQEPMPRDGHVPRLGEIMLAKQWRHMKLWFAVKGRNWSLAAYELAQMRASLVDAATLYLSIPVSDVTIMAGPLQSIEKAIQSKDNANFIKDFAELTSGCNECHRDMGRAFIEIKVPKDLPFSNQVFAPPTTRY